MSVHARLAAYYFAFFAQAGAFLSYFALYLQSRGLGAGEIALAVAMPQLARIVAPGLWGWLADVWDGARAVGGPRPAGARRAIVIFSSFAMLAGFVSIHWAERPGSVALVLLASFGCAVVRFLAIGWGVESVAVLAAAQLLHAATFGAFHAGSVAAVHRLFQGPHEARGQALFSTLAYGVGGALGSLVAGWTWGVLGASASFATSALFALAGAALVAWRVRV